MRGGCDLLHQYAHAALPHIALPATGTAPKDRVPLHCLREKDETAIRFQTDRQTEVLLQTPRRVVGSRTPFLEFDFSCLRAGCRDGGCAVLPCSSRLCRAAQTPLPSDGVRMMRFCTSQVRIVAPTHPHVILFPTPEHALCLNGMWRTKERGGSGSTPQSPRQSFPTAAQHVG